MRKKKHTLTALEALDNIHECGEWIPVDATAIIRKELIEFEELKQMEQELGITFKELCLFLKEGFAIEFNGKNVVAHSKRP